MPPSGNDPRSTEPTAIAYIMRYARLITRLILLGGHVLLGALLCITCLPDNNDTTLNTRQQRIIQWWLSACGRLIGLRIRTVGRATTEHGCYVCNHISWLDIVTIGGLHPVRFLSKSEVARWPMIGYLARCAGTIFIQRGNGARAAFETIKKRLQRGENIALFPEGTTGSAYDIRRFHPRLFGAVIDAQAQAQPVAIGYPLNKRQNENIPFRDNQSFLENALEVLKQPHVDVVVRYARPISADDRKVFAEQARALVTQESEAIYAP